MISVAGPTNTQKYSVQSHDFSTNELAEVSMLPLCRLQLLSRPRVFTVLDFNEVHMPLVYMELVGHSGQRTGEKKDCSARMCVESPFAQPFLEITLS
eukprot:1150638-Pelagomonas_calceolata.AAC.1